MNKVKVLVVEDELIIANHIQSALKNLGYDVPAIASTGADAVKKAGELKPDIVLMDIVLKGEMNGIEAASQIKSIYRIPLIYLTAYEDEETLDRAKVTEPMGYILKPFQERDLRITLELALYRHAMDKKLFENEARLRELVERSPDGIVIEINKKITYVNPAALKLLREKDVTKLHKKTVFDFLHPDKLDTFKQKLIHMKENRPVTFIEEDLIRTDGSKFCAEIATIPLVNNGETALEVIFREITKEKTKA